VRYKRGWVIFTRDHKSIISNAICRFQEYSHVAIITDDTNNIGHTHVIEADQYGVQENDLESRLHDGVEIEVYEITRKNIATINAAVDKMYEYIGKHYGYIAIIGFLVVYAMDRIGIKINNPIRRGHVCSELVYKYTGKIVGDIPRVDPSSVDVDFMLGIYRHHDNCRLVYKGAPANFSG
jgi:hypothetical protein